MFIAYINENIFNEQIQIHESFSIHISAHRVRKIKYSENI